jgi:hypothetical protein
VCIQMDLRGSALESASGRRRTVPRDRCPQPAPQRLLRGLWKATSAGVRRLQAWKTHGARGNGNSRVTAAHGFRVELP